MKRTKKILSLALCAVLLVAGTVATTVAYLTDTDTVTNTFAVGSVDITLDEAEVNIDGKYADAEKGHDARVDANKYHLLPGHTYYKDPTVTVIAGSEDAYVRMIVTVERIDQLKAALPTSEIVYGEDGTTGAVVNPDNEKYYGEDGTFLLQMLCVDENGKCTWDEDIWKMNQYTESPDGTKGYYEFRYVGNDTENAGNGIVVKDDTKNTVLQDLFTHITVPGEIDNTHLAYLDDVEIVVNAHAIQADGFKDADAAWAAFSN